MTGGITIEWKVLPARGFAAALAMIRMRVRLFLSLGVIAGLWPAQGQGLSDKPVLRIETGQHSAAIRSIDADTSERFLVTGSEDKTVRLWDLPSGRLLRTFRLPIGDGYDGRVNAAAISPDGRLIAAGGVTGSVSEKISIYLFERDSGRLYKRISGLPNVIGHLAYSPDGRFLVATLGAKNGIRLYRTADYTQVAEDRDYGGVRVCAVFLQAGQSGG